MYRCNQLGQRLYKYIRVILHDWLINWCLTPTLAVFQLYTCHNTRDIFDDVCLCMLLLHWQRNHVQSDLNRTPHLLPHPLYWHVATWEKSEPSLTPTPFYWYVATREKSESSLTPLYWYVSAWDICRNPMTKRVIIVFTILFIHEIRALTCDQ